MMTHASQVEPYSHLPLRVMEPSDRHEPSGSITVCDAADNDVAEFFHRDHATVGQSYEEALALAYRFVLAASFSAPPVASEAATLQAALERIRAMAPTEDPGPLSGWDGPFSEGEDLGRHYADVARYEIGQIAATALATTTGSTEDGAGLRDALELILPMAKGYAAAHPVGSNARKIEHAERALAAPTESAGGERPISDEDRADYWKGAYDRMAARNIEIEARLAALTAPQKV